MKKLVILLLLVAFISASCLHVGPGTKKTDEPCVKCHQSKQRCLACHNSYIDNTPHDPNLIKKPHITGSTIYTESCVVCHMSFHVNCTNVDGNTCTDFEIFLGPDLAYPSKGTGVSPTKITLDRWNGFDWTKFPEFKAFLQNVIAPGLKKGEICMEVVFWDLWTNDYLGNAAPAGVDENNWKVCYNCHFIRILPQLGTAYGGDTAYYTHADTCLPCHGAITYVQDDVWGAGGALITKTFWSHDFTRGESLWYYCTNCHQNYVAGSAHEAIGCKCHSVVHVGYNASGQWFAGLFTHEAASADVITPTVLANKLFAYNELNATSSLRQYLGQYSGPRNVEAGLWDAYANDFVSTFPLGSLSQPRAWLLCFNCHFIAVNPSQVGKAELKGGVLKIGISPDIIGRVDPHTLKPLKKNVEAPLRSISPYAILLLIAFIIGVKLLKRE